MLIKCCKQNCNLAAILICILLSASSWCYSESPVHLGQPCSEMDVTYLWTISTRTTWAVTDLYAVPVGIPSPQDWQSAAAFHGRLLQVLPPNPDIPAFATACASVWREFFSQQADVLVSLTRTINTTARQVRCVAGVWAVASEEVSTVPEDSGWLRVGDQPFDVTSGSSNQLLDSRLQALTDQLNAQPGADTATVESFVKEE